MASSLCDFSAGWFGGVIGLIVGHPFDTLKVRQQSLQNPSLWHVTKSCFQFEGVQGFFKGMYYPLLSAGALNSLFFGVYGMSLNAMTELRTGKPATKVKPTYWEVYWAGCAGGAAQLAVSCPVDLAKIRLQTQIKAAGAQGCSKLSPYKVLRDIYMTKGLTGWYQGLVPMALRDVPSYGVYIMVYEMIVDRLCDRRKGQIPTPFQSVWVGGVAGTVSWVVVIYFDVVKSRMQADCPINPKYNGTIDTFQQCYREGGIKIFGRGMVAVSLRAFPLNGATFLGYEYILDICRKSQRES